jgi:hypothetical protein
MGLQLDDYKPAARPAFWLLMHRLLKYSAKHILSKLWVISVKKSFHGKPKQLNVECIYATA